MKKRPASKSAPVVPTTYPRLVVGIGSLLENSRHTAARAVNSLMTATYWEIGRRIVEFEQGGKKRADYCEELLKRLAADLTARYGRGFSQRSLQNMRSFFSCFPPDQIWQTLSAKSAPAPGPTTLTLDPIGPARRPLSLADLGRAFPLPWSHDVLLVSARSAEDRHFYHAEALRGGWSVRQLDRQINSLFYERTALSKNKTSMMQKGAQPQPGDALTADQAIRDPLVLEFLNLRDEYSESELETALIRHLETFLLELGGDFTFVGRQRRLRIDDEWYRVDLLLFHRRLRCLVIVDLHPVRYPSHERILLRLRPPQHCGRQFLHRLHARSAQSAQQAPTRLSRFHEETFTGRTDLLRSVPQSAGRNASRKIPEDRLGKALPQFADEALSNGVKLGKFTHADAGQMHLYLSYAKEHWTHPEENPPVGLILCSSAGQNIVRYTLDTLPTKVMARDYRVALPDERKLVRELARARKQLDARSRR